MLVEGIKGIDGVDRGDCGSLGANEVEDVKNDNFGDSHFRVVSFGGTTPYNCHHVPGISMRSRRKVR